MNHFACTVDIHTTLQINYNSIKKSKILKIKKKKKKKIIGYKSCFPEAQCKSEINEILIVRSKNKSQIVCAFIFNLYPFFLFFLSPLKSKSSLVKSFLIETQWFSLLFLTPLSPHYLVLISNMAIGTQDLTVLI